MTVDELVTIFSYLGSFSAGALVTGIIVAYLLKSYLPAYLREKGKNLATKEDIGAITEEIENVKSEYAQTLQNLTHQNNLLMEEVRSRHQLRMAALDRRLQAHQEAYTHWRRLLYNLYHESVHPIVLECQTWWDENCLYLSAEAREAFQNAYKRAARHRDLVQVRSNPGLEDKNWDHFIEAGDLIVKGAELPSLGDGESHVIQDK